MLQELPAGSRVLGVLWALLLVFGWTALTLGFSMVVRINYAMLFAYR